jgi:hypothetical protein
MRTTHTLPPFLAEYLSFEIPPMELAALLDGHLHDIVEWIAKSGQPITEEQTSAYHHIRRLRDLMLQLATEMAGSKSAKLQALNP